MSTPDSLPGAMPLVSNIMSPELLLQMASNIKSAISNGRANVMAHPDSVRGQVPDANEVRNAADGPFVHDMCCPWANQSSI